MDMGFVVTHPNKRIHVVEINVLDLDFFSAALSVRQLLFVQKTPTLRQ